ncbi:MAG: DUF2889 domain-containing protein [Halopseudomonas sp.]
MPLPPASPRKHLHTRQVTCHGYEREDGLFDIEGRMIDTKTYDINNRDRGGQIKAGESIHDMSIRLTMDLDFLIHEVEAVIDYSPFSLCPSIVDRFKQLEGLSIAPGWNSKVKKLFKGTQGCTHLAELLGPIATTAFQSTGTARRLRAEKNKTAPAGANRLINSCHAMAEDSEVIRLQWPEHYRPTNPAKQ